MDHARARRPVLIFGLTPRTGTNYLWDLMLQHPDCARGREPIREDFFLQESGHLVDYVRSVHGTWDPAWGEVSQDLLDELAGSIGAGLLDFLTVDVTRRLVTKNPSVVHLDRVFTLFPEAQVVLLVRDGRAVVESCGRTFGWDFDLAARRWATAATTALAFVDERLPGDERVAMVRYEDLVADVPGEMGRLLGHLGLDVDRYDFEAATRLPVRGSSVFLGPGRTRVHWDPVEATSEFDPLRRWDGWTPAQHERFAWLAGPQQTALGYSLERTVLDTRSAGLRHNLVTARWQARRSADVAVYRLRGWLGPRTRRLRGRKTIAP